MEEDLPLEMDDGKNTNKVRWNGDSWSWWSLPIIGSLLPAEGRDGGRTLSHLGEIKTKPAAGLSEGESLNECFCSISYL